MSLRFLNPGLVSVSRSMHRLLGGSASAFDARHDRVGYLFQSRFKSIVVQEEPVKRCYRIRAAADARSTFS